MRITPLPLEERIATGADYEVQIEHSDLTNAVVDGTQTLTIPIAAKMAVRLLRMVLDVAFKNSADATNNSLLVTVGDGGSANRFLTSTELNENGTEIPLKAGVDLEYPYTADDTIDVIFTPDSGFALSALDTGRLRLLFAFNDYRAIAPSIA